MAGVPGRPDPGAGRMKAARGRQGGARAAGGGGADCRARITIDRQRRWTVPAMQRAVAATKQGLETSRNAATSDHACSQVLAVLAPALTRYAASERTRRFDGQRREALDEGLHSPL